MIVGFHSRETFQYEKKSRRRLLRSAKYEQPAREYHCTALLPCYFMRYIMFLNVTLRKLHPSEGTRPTILSQFDFLQSAGSWKVSLGFGSRPRAKGFLHFLLPGGIILVFILRLVFVTCPGQEMIEDRKQVMRRNMEAFSPSSMIPSRFHYILWDFPFFSRLQSTTHNTGQLSPIFP